MNYLLKMMCVFFILILYSQAPAQLLPVNWIVYAAPTCKIGTNNWNPFSMYEMLFEPCGENQNQEPQTEVLAVPEIQIKPRIRAH